MHNWIIVQRTYYFYYVYRFALKWWWQPSWTPNKFPILFSRVPLSPTCWKGIIFIRLAFFFFSQIGWGPWGAISKREEEADKPLRGLTPTQHVRIQQPHDLLWYYDDNMSGNDKKKTNKQTQDQTEKWRWILTNLPKSKKKRKGQMFWVWG